FNAGEIRQARMIRSDPVPSVYSSRSRVRINPTSFRRLDPRQTRPLQLNRSKMREPALKNSRDARSPSPVRPNTPHFPPLFSKVREQSRERRELEHRASLNRSGNPRRLLSKMRETAKIIAGARSGFISVRSRPKSDNTIIARLI